jgi:hypothetical protein
MAAKDKSYNFIVDGMKRDNEVLLKKALETIPGINKVIIDSTNRIIQIFAHKRNKKDFGTYINAAIEALGLPNINVRTSI